MLAAPSEHPATVRNQWHIETWAAGLAGALLALFIIGPSRVDPNNANWLIGDFAQVQLAWEQFRQEPHWWTLTTTRLSFPLPIGIALFDTAPIVTFVFRLFSGQLPEPFQYIGLYLAACLALQGFFGALCLRALWDLARPDDTRLKRTTVFVGSLLFVLMPATILRFRGHMALSSHWLIVASIWLSLKFLGEQSRKNWLLCVAVVFFATAINPYIGFLSSMSPILACLVLPGTLRQRGIRTLAMAAMLGVVFIFSSWLFGFLAGAVPDRTGYGFYSMNMLSPIDIGPFSGLFSNSFALATPGQGEGFNYLGVGILLLLLLAAVMLPFKARTGWRPRHDILALGLLAIAISYVLALSTKVTFGSAVLFDLHLPERLMNVLAEFRASGRLFWLGAFWAIALGFFGVLTIRTARAILPIVLAASILQALDIRDVVKQVHSEIASYNTHALELPFSEQQVRNVKYVHVVPPWQCNPQQTPGGPQSFEYIGRLAVDHGWFQNSFYSGRVPVAQSAYHCSEPHLVPADEALQDKTLYIVSRASYPAFLSKTQGRVACEEVRDFLMCLPESAAQNAAPPATP